MSDAWATVLLAGAITLAIKGAGPVAMGGRALPARLAGVIELLAPALLTALVVVQIFGGDRRLELDERALGLAAAIVAVACRAPVLVVVIVAAVVTALARQI